MKEKQLQVQPVVQLLVGSFNHETNKHRRFIPVPLGFKGGHFQDAWAAEYASAQCGEGVQLECGTAEEPGGRFLLLVEDGASARCVDVPPGNWIIDYSYTRNDGVWQAKLFLAAEVL